MISLRTLACIALLLLSACGNDAGGSEPRSFQACGLPTPQPDAKPSVIPEGFVPAGSEVTRGQKERGGFLAAINLRAGVTDAFEMYQDILKEEGYQITGLDNEGFEAEVFFKKDDKLGAIQIRTSRCEDATIVFIQLVDRRFLG